MKGSWISVDGMLMQSGYLVRCLEEEEESERMYKRMTRTSCIVLLCEFALFTALKLYA